MNVSDNQEQRQAEEDPVKLYVRGSVIKIKSHYKREIHGEGVCIVEKVPPGYDAINDPEVVAIWRPTGNVNKEGFIELKRIK